MLLTTKQVAEKLGVSRQTVYRMVERHQLTAIHLSPRNYRFRSDELERLLDVGTASSDAEAAS